MFLCYALISFLALFSFTSLGLMVNAPWFILSALAYVVGFVGYFAGKENTVNGAVKSAKRHFSIKINPLWSFPAGAFTTLALLALHLGLGFQENMTSIFGIPSPVFVSFAAGVVVGLLSLVLLRVLDKW